MARPGAIWEDPGPGGGWVDEPPHQPPPPPRRRLGRGSGGGGGSGYDARRLILLVLGVLGLTAAILAVQRVPDQAAADPEVAPDPNAPTSGFKTPGVLTFRGSPTRSYYGAGPIPQTPKVVWTYPGDGEKMCANSEVDKGEHAGDFLWCGSGWTGQPAVFEREGRTWVVFGAYDKKIHFVDWETGEDILPPYELGDIIKGSVTVDPDGFPIIYTGSRDNFVHMLSIDGDEAVDMYQLPHDTVTPTLWNNDWDGSPLVMNDYMYEGGENSQFYAVKLNRAYDADGKVTVAPEIAFNTPGWDDELLAELEKLDEGKAEEDRRRDDVSIENSVAYFDGVVYFANSGGLVQGWDVSGLPDEKPTTPVFRFWTGDDTDASVVIDDEGFLYVASQVERDSPRSEEVGQLMKLDPRKPDDPLVWSLKDPRGFWATPAIQRDILIAPSDNGKIYALDRATGEVRWTKVLPGPTWSSPAIVDDVWIQGDCAGGIHAFDVSDTKVTPPELWNVQVVGCVESSPAVWGGRIFVGTRAGRFVAVGD